MSREEGHYFPVVTLLLGERTSWSKLGELVRNLHIFIISLI